MKRIAVIDLGTNTFNLLVIDKTEKGFKEIYGEKVAVGLGLGGINQDMIHPEAIERGLATLQKYKAQCQTLEVDEIVAFGTSAIRNADNQAEFTHQARALTGIEVRVISGEKEAELIYKGVTIGVDIHEPFLIMDIGGGSTEFILGDANQLIEMASFEIGAARIYQSFEFSDPYTVKDCQKVEAYLSKGIADFFDQIYVENLIGASGSFETFYELLSGKPYPDNEYVELSKEELMEQLERIIFSTKAEREKDDRIIPIRKKMAPIAALKIRWIIRKLNIQKIMISPYSMKEGVITEMAL